MATYPSVEDIRHFFSYDPLTGYLSHRLKRSKKTVAGARAGTPVRPNDHRMVSLNKRLYPEHRIIWLWLYGELDPAMDIDHINGVRDDNRQENLRLADRSQNLWNAKLLARNTSGVKGVNYSQKDRMWRIQISHRGQRHTSYYKTKESAVAAVPGIRERLHGAFACDGQLR